MTPINTGSDHDKPVSPDEKKPILNKPASSDEEKPIFSDEWKNLDKYIEIIQSFFSFPSAREIAESKVLSLLNEPTIPERYVLVFLTFLLGYLNNSSKEKDAAFIKSMLRISRILVKHTCDLENPPLAKTAKTQLITLMSDMQDWLMKHRDIKGKGRLFRALVYIITQVREKIQQLNVKQVSNRKFLENTALIFIIQAIKLTARIDFKSLPKLSLAIHEHILIINDDQNMDFINQIIEGVQIKYYWRFIQNSTDADAWDKLQKFAPDDYLEIIQKKSKNTEQEQAEMLSDFMAVSLISVSGKTAPDEDKTAILTSPTSPTIPMKQATSSLLSIDPFDTTEEDLPRASTLVWKASFFEPEPAEGQSDNKGNAGCEMPSIGPASRSGSQRGTIPDIFSSKPADTTTTLTKETTNCLVM